MSLEKIFSKRVWSRGCGSRDTRGWINFEGKDKVMWQKHASEAIAMRRAKRAESLLVRQILMLNAKTTGRPAQNVESAPGMRRHNRLA